MPSVYKPKGRTIYRIEFTDQHGEMKKISSGMKDRRAAEGLAHLIERDAERIRAGQQPLEPTLTAAHLGLVLPGNESWEHFRKRFESEHASGLRPHTRTKYQIVLNAFEQEMKPKRIKDVTEATVSQFAAALRKRPVIWHGKVQRQGLAPWSIKSYLASLKKVLTWAADQKLIPARPQFPEILVPKLKPQPIDPAEWEKLFAEAPTPLWKAYLLCGWLGGLRLQEAFWLRRSKCVEWPWLDLACNRIMLPGRFVKAAEDQWVPLHPKLRAALEALPVTAERVFPFRSQMTGGDLTPKGAGNNVLNFARRAGVKPGWCPGRLLVE